MKEIVVYTALFGERDDLRETPIYDCADYFCFTDNKDIKSDNWKVIYIEKEEDPFIQYKKFKFFPHKYFKEYKYSIWLDGTRILKISPDVFIKTFLKESLIARFKGNNINNVYDEAREVIRLGYLDRNSVISQMREYKEEGYNGKDLTCGGVIIRKHNNQKLIKYSEECFNEILKGRKREQLSADYLLWKNEIKCSIINENIYDTKYLEVFSHKNTKEKKVYLFNQKLKKFLLVRVFILPVYRKLRSFYRINLNKILYYGLF